MTSVFGSSDPLAVWGRRILHGPRWFTVTRRVIFYPALPPKFIMAIPGSQATPFHAHLCVLTCLRLCSHTHDHVHLPMTSFACSWPRSLAFDYAHTLLTMSIGFQPYSQVDVTLSWEWMTVNIVDLLSVDHLYGPLCLVRRLSPEMLRIHPYRLSHWPISLCICTWLGMYATEMLTRGIIILCA